jgi:hypothetical protein
MYLSMYVCLSVRPSALTERFLMIFFEHLSRKWNFHQNLTTTTGFLREGQCVFTTAHRSIILVMRYNSDKHYTKAKKCYVL